MLPKPLKILVFTDSLVLIAGAMIVPFYALFVETIGGDILEAGAAASTFALAAGVSALVAGRLSDKIKRKERVIVIAYFILALSFLSYIYVNSIWVLLLLQIVIGLVQAAYAPAFDALYGEHIGDRRLASSRWSIWESSNYFAIAIGATVGATIVHFASFSGLFVAMAILCAMSGAYLFASQEAFAKKSKQEG